MPDYVTRVILDPAPAVAGGAKANETFDQVKEKSRGARDSVEALSKQFEQLERDLDPVIARQGALYDTIELVTRAQLAGLTTEAEAIRLINAKKVALDSQVLTYEKVLAQLQSETALMRLSDDERAKRLRLMEIEQNLAREGIVLTEEQTNALRREIVAQQSLAREKQAANSAGAGGGGGLSGLASKAGGALVAGLAVGEVVHLGDEYISLENRLKLVTSSSEELKRVTEELYGVAQQTRTGWEGTAELYQRLTNATKALGLGERERIDLTREINELAIESGVSSQEAANGIRQLSQGLASGTLRGQDLRAALEDIPALGQAIADGLGVSVGQLRKLGEDGTLTADKVVQALEKVQDKTHENFGKTSETVDQALTELKNSFVKLAADLAPIISALAKVIGGLADAIGFAADHLEAFAVGASLFTPAGPFVLGVDLAYHGIGLLSDGLSALGDVLGISSDGADDLIKRFIELQKQIDAMTDSIDASTASFRTWSFLALNGVNVQALGASITVRTLANEITKTTQAMVYSKDILDEYATQVKSFTRDTVREIERLRQEQKHHAEEAATAHHKLVEDLDRLIGKQSEATKAAKELAEANKTLDAAVRAHMITQARANEIRTATIANIAAEQLAAAKFSDTMKTVNEDLKAYDQAQRSIAGLPKGKTGLGSLDLEASIEHAKELLEKENQIHDAMTKMAADQSWSRGITDGLGKIREEGLNLRDAFDHLAVDSVHKLSDSIVDLVTTGKANFSDLANSVIRELARIATNQLLAQLLGAIGFTSTSEGGLAGLIAGAPKHQTGTDYIVPGSGGTDSQVQIFRATPGERVTVQTPAQQVEAAAAARNSGVVGIGARPVVNLKNVNILDPRMIPQALATSEGQAALVNAIATRPELLRAAMRARRR